MDEKTIKSQLVKVTKITIISSIVICALVLGTFSYVMNQAHESDHIQMKTEVEEYKVRISKQIDKNIQILTTLAKSYEISKITDSEDLLEKSIAETNKANSFVSMAYISIKNYGIINAPNIGTKRGITLDDFNEYSRAAIKQSFNGENAVSKMFDSEIYDGKLFVYSVPVYENSQIIGAIAASDTLEIFEDIVNGHTVLSGQGYIHLLDGEGDFLVRSQNTLVKEDLSSIFDGPYLSESERESVEKALKSRESMYGDFMYKGRECHFYISPMDINGWYIFCANKLWGPTLSFGRSVMILGAVLFSLLIIMFFILYYSYYRFRKNSSLLIKLAYYDNITGTINTLRFDQKFEQIRDRQKNYCIAALNIHNFKWINDLFGIEDGNKVLRYIKSEIEANLKPDEFFCRDSADLFYLFLADDKKQILSKRISMIISNIKETTAHDNYGYELSLYCGMSINGTREQALVALQSIKHNMQVDIAYYDSKLHELMRKKNDIESHMMAALKNREFEMFLQPKIDLKSGKIASAEALVRWRLPDGSYRYPNEFIPIFEANGFSEKLDIYMIEQTCILLRKWTDDGVNPLPISVNQSKRLFANGKYPEEITKIVESYNIPASLITLEILENIASGDTDQINNQIESLHKIGFKISMDDFGSGYSSLNMLYRLKIDELKLDKGFMKKVSVDDDERRKTMLNQIISFAKKLGVSTVAEGIETEEDQNYMISLCCDYGQGYYYDKPLNKEKFSKKYIYGKDL